MGKVGHCAPWRHCAPTAMAALCAKGAGEQGCVGIGRRIVLLVQFAVQGLAINLKNLRGQGPVASDHIEDMVHIALHHVRHRNQFSGTRHPMDLAGRIMAKVEYLFREIIRDNLSMIG